MSHPSGWIGSDHDWERIPPRNGSLAMRCVRCRTVWLCHERKPRRACTVPIDDRGGMPR